MTNDITKQWSEISKTAIESMKELGNINTKVMEKLIEQQLAVLNTCMEASQKEIELAASGENAQNPQALVAAQAELMAEYNSKLMKIVQSTGNILKDCNSEITSCTDKGMNIAQKTAPKTTKKGPKEINSEEVNH
ncbi:MAG: phasin family protein [Gammaproteobacteria bacterium]